MSRATDEWQESMRYALDTGTLPARPRRRRLRRVFLLSCLGITSAVAVANYSGSGPAGRPDGDTIAPPRTLALANTEPVKKRSFTRKSAIEADKADAASQTAGALPPKVATAAPGEPDRSPEPAATGAPAERVQNSDDGARTPSAKRLAPREMQSPRIGQRSAGLSGHRTSRRAARRSNALAEVAHASLPASSPVRSRRPQPVLARTPAERIAAAGRPKTTVCLYFVLCL
jgi:hypothetical protein